MNKIIASFCFGLAGLFTTVGVASSQQPIEYSVVEQSLDKVVEDIVAASGTPVQIQEPDNVVVRNWNARGSTSEVVRDLSKRLGLHYDFDGASYELVLNRHQISAVLPVEGRNRASAMKVIRSAFPDYSMGSVRWVAEGQGNVVMLRGSKRFIETISALLKACPQGCRQFTVIRGGLAQTVDR